MIFKIVKDNEDINKHQLKYLQIIENEVNKLSHVAHDILNYVNTNQ